MSTCRQIAKHFREVHFGGNWTCSNLKDQLADVSWEEALIKPPLFNSIATLAYHIHYFVEVTAKVLEGGELNGDDKKSFNHPEMHSEQDWQRFLERKWKTAEKFAALLESFPDDRLHENMADPKYGSWYRNLHGIIEHAHYHLGQIVLIKKILREPDKIVRIPNSILH